MYVCGPDLKREAVRDVTYIWVNGGGMADIYDGACVDDMAVVAVQLVDGQLSTCDLHVIETWWGGGT